MSAAPDLTPDQREAVERGKATALHIEEARLTRSFDLLFEYGGPAACLHIITVLVERLAELLRRQAVRLRAAQQSGVERPTPPFARAE